MLPWSRGPAGPAFCALLFLPAGGICRQELGPCPKPALLWSPKTAPVSGASRVRHTTIHGVCAVPRTDMVLVPEEGEATSQLSHRQAQSSIKKRRKVVGARCSQRLWAGPRDWPLSRAHQPPVHIHPAILYPSPGSACPSSALVVPLPRAAQPG